MRTSSRTPRSGPSWPLPGFGSTKYRSLSTTPILSKANTCSMRAPLLLVRVAPATCAPARDSPSFAGWRLPRVGPVHVPVPDDRRQPAALRRLGAGVRAVMAELAGLAVDEVEPADNALAALEVAVQQVDVELVRLGHDSRDLVEQLLLPVAQRALPEAPVVGRHVHVAGLRGELVQRRVRSVAGRLARGNPPAVHDGHPGPRVANR